MKKIPTMFQRDEVRRGRPVIPVIKAECQWVLDGEGTATRKLDGTNVKIENGILFKRQKPKEGDYNEASYIPANREDPADQYIFEAYDLHMKNLPIRIDGIYEAVGPKIQGNPEKHDCHVLYGVLPPWDCLKLSSITPRTFEGLKQFLSQNDFEGIVFHHEDGRMAKIKGRDFGIKRRLSNENLSSGDVGK